MKIGELADATSTGIETIRFYERKGLLSAPPRSAGNYRVYTAVHAARLAFIRRCRALDMSLDEIRALLRFKDAPEENCEEVNELLDVHIGHVTRRIEELKGLHRSLKELRSQCDQTQSARECGILEELSRAASAESLEPARVPGQPTHELAGVHHRHDAVTDQASVADSTGKPCRRD